MGCWYSVHGNITVQANEETRQILSELEELCNEIEIEEEMDRNDGTYTLKISGMQYGSYTNAEEIDTALYKFSPFVVGGPARFSYRCDDENGEIWIGSEEEIKKSKALKLFENARQALKQLTKEQIQMLLNRQGEVT